MADVSQEVVAQGFNCTAAKVTEYDDISPTIEKLSKAGPALVNLIVSVKPTSPATLSMVGPTADPNVGYMHDLVKNRADIS